MERCLKTCLRLALPGCVLFLWLFEVVAVDLSRAVVVCPKDLSGPEQKAVTMLIEEVEKRTHVDLRHATEWPATTATPVIAVGQISVLRSFAGEITDELEKEPSADGAEGYHIRIRRGKGGSSVVLVAGN